MQIDVFDKRILFLDRPDRIVTSVRTSDFVGNGSTGIDSFKVDAPNAVLNVDESEIQNISITELFNPFYNVDKKTLKVDITPDNGKSIDMPKIG